MRMSCEWEAGQSGMHCKHRINLLVGTSAEGLGNVLPCERDMKATIADEVDALEPRGSASREPRFSIRWR